MKGNFNAEVIIGNKFYPFITFGKWATEYSFIENCIRYGLMLWDSLNFNAPKGLSVQCTISVNLQKQAY